MGHVAKRVRVSGVNTIYRLAMSRRYMELSRQLSFLPACTSSCLHFYSTYAQLKWGSAE